MLTAYPAQRDGRAFASPAVRRYNKRPFSSRPWESKRHSQLGQDSRVCVRLVRHAALLLCLCRRGSGWRVDVAFVRGTRVAKAFVTVWGARHGS